MSAIAPANDKPERVLVVDDDSDIRSAVQELLADEGYSTVGAANGQMAMDWLRSAPAVPALILLDLMMPQMDGWEFLLRIDHSDRFRGIPVAIMSAHPSVRQAQREGDTSFGGRLLLPKPLDPGHLLDLVAGVVPHPHAGPHPNVGHS
jgi:CheY-like chemotaxis protein